MLNAAKEHDNERAALKRRNDRNVWAGLVIYDLTFRIILIDLDNFIWLSLVK